MISTKIRKTIAVFLLINILSSIVAPTVTYALTSGPTAPEATSFEPVDTTDLVDLKSGDFTYNIPLIEVPGPAGGYPLSLSYHAGIQPNQEASWVGLGFTLNPGSISRLVNGYPDDHNNVTNVDRSFWKGGETETKTIGISYGIANVASVSAGLSFAQDTYKGKGVGGYVGFGLGYQITSSVGIGFNESFGISPYGDTYASAGISLGVSAGSNEGLNASASLGLSINSNSQLNVGAGAGVGVRQTSLMGASIGSNGSKPSLSVGGGVSGIYNGKADKVSINSEGFQIDIPVYYGLSLRLGRDYQRYWIDESTGIHTFGSLYIGDVPPNFLSAFDTYDLLDTNLDMVDHNDAEKVLGGSFPDVDLYSVTAQGVGGNIRPYHFQQHLYRQDKKDKDNKVLSKSYKLSSQSTKKPVEFRFLNDFSNRLEYNPNDFNVESSHVSFDFDENTITGKTGTDGFVNNHLAGSKHVEWYTNQEIMLAKEGVNPFEEGFVNCQAEGFARDNSLQIGGFSITNASGVTYHYALPAYSFNEYMRSENSSTKQDQDGLTYNELKKPEKYAYTWFLTSVTGPDYVDRNSNGLADHGDWGYWVDFRYKKFLDDYNWRNPGEGFNRDIDGDFNFFASGKKEIYYLDKIVTETHVAVFEKSTRVDSREVIDPLGGGFEPTPILQQTEENGQCSEACERYLAANDPGGFSSCLAQCNADFPPQVTGYNFPRSLLKLDKINLYNYSDFASGRVDESFMLRSISFGYEYFLAPGTPNSYSQESFGTKLGKLTLKKLEFAGKKGISLIPPMSFDYKNMSYGKEGEQGKDMVDIWGFYKSDFGTTFRDQTNDIIGRETTSVSALDVDAWSLNTIVTSLGADITILYESDQYEDVGLSKQQILRTKDVVDYGQDKLKLTFWEQGLDLSKYFEVGQSLEIDLVGSYKVSKQTAFKCFCTPTFPDDYFEDGLISKLLSGKVDIDQVDINNGFIIVRSSDYYNWLKNTTKYIKGDFGTGGPFTTTACGSIIGTNECTLTYSGANAWPDFFPVGVVSVPEKTRFGGGLRVKSISINSSQGSRETMYEYEGGTVSYEPYEILAPKIHPDYSHKEEEVEQVSQYYKKAIFKKLYRQIGIARQVPGPDVMYRFVNIKEKNTSSDGVVQTLPNHTRYEFETYKEGMVGMTKSDVRIEDVEGSYDEVNFTKVYLNKVSLKDFSSRVGNLNSITLYNSVDNRPVSKTINHYLHDDLDDSFEDNIGKYEAALSSNYLNQGLVEETFSRARIMHFDWNDVIPYSNLKAIFDSEVLLGSIIKMESFPSIPTGQTNINYKTGGTSTTQNLAFDFYSGDPTEVLTTDSYGNKYLSRTVPAYHHYDGMGLKIYNKTNRNMLSQTAEQYSFVLGAQAPTGVLAASIQTWSDKIPVLNVTDGQPNIWRKQASYFWNGQQALLNDGSYPIEDFNANPFPWSSLGSNLNWEKAGELTLYDTYTHGLEAKDINGNFSSTRMNEDQTRVIASASNSKYQEMAYSGIEYSIGNSRNEGGVNRGFGNPSTAHAHTGKYSLLVGYGSEGFNFKLSPQATDLSKSYRASVWVYAPGEAENQDELSKIKLYYSENGQEKKSVHPILQKSKSKSWYLLNLDITPGGSKAVYIGVHNSTSRGIYFDDFRVHPIDASLSSFVYDHFSGELSYILDANNFYTRFEYDAMGRLVRTSKELLNFDYGEGNETFRADAILSEIQYNYEKK